MKNFTFKKQKEEGKYKSFQANHIDIKLNKKVVGYISKGDEGYKISFAVKKEKTKEKPAPFEWRKIKLKFCDEGEARSWIKDNKVGIQNSLNLYQFEE